MALTLPNPKDFFGSGSKLTLIQTEAAVYGQEAGGLIRLFNTIMKIAIYGALLFALINLLVSAIQFINASGNPESLKQASGRIWISLLGVVVAVSSLVLAGLFGLILFGNATAIINPVIYGP